MIECTLDILAPGHFESELDLYLDDEGLQEIPLTVHGVAATPGSKEDQPPR
jgi:hypothetical protein